MHQSLFRMTGGTAHPALVPVPRTEERPAGRRTWRAFSAELADVLCVECTGRGMPTHAREEYALVLSSSGGAMVDPQGRASPVGRDEVGIAMPGEIYGIEPATPGGTVQVLLLGPSMVAPPARGSAVPALTEPLRFRTPVVRDAPLAAKLHASFGDLRRGLTALDALARLRDTLRELAARHIPREPVPNAARRTHPGAARAHTYVREHFMEALTMDALVAVSRISRFYLLRVFQRDYGVTPHEYQRQLRLAHACRLLATGTPPSRAAYEAGFSDQSHLNRLLKSRIGLTPGVFGKQWAGARPAPTHALREDP